MYENLLHQDEISGRLKRDFLKNSLPPAMLFSGPVLSGKLTAALETARVLSCEKTGDWRCSCGLCAQHRVLTHPHTIITGARDLGPEIAASAELFRRDTSEGPRYLLVRSARKLLRRFDPLLWEGEEKKFVRVLPVMERLSENVDSLLPGSALLSAGKLEKLLECLVDDCLALQKFLPGVLPISQVRHITNWAAHSAGNDHKTVIIDSADRMLPSAKNALLKFLEEPPPETTAILIVERKSLLLPTIVSRLRDYSFRARMRTEEDEILQRVFREDGKRYNGLHEYFKAWRAAPSEHIKNLAHDFIEGAKAGYYPEEMHKITDHLQLNDLLEAMSIFMQTSWKENCGSIPLSQSREIEYLREARIRAESLNLPIPLILRSLHLSLGLAE